MIAWLFRLPEAARSIKTRMKYWAEIQNPNKVSCIKKARILEPYKIMIHSMNANIQKNVAFLFYEFWWVLHNIKLRHKHSWCNVKEIWWPLLNKVSYEFVLAFFSLKRKKHLSNFLVSQMQMATEWWLLNSTRILIRKLDDYWMNIHYVLRSSCITAIINSV